MAATDVTPATPAGTPAPPAAPPRRRRLTSRVSSGHVITIVAALVAVVLNFAVLRGGDGEVAIVVAAADIPAGAPIDATSFRTVPGSLEAGTLGSLLVQDDLRAGAFAGRVAAVPIPAGAPVRWSDLAEASSLDPGGRRIAIPVDRAHAVGGEIAPEDRIDVIRVADGRASYLVSGARVLAVAAEPSPGLGALGGFHVTIAVDAETALCLAAAIETGGLTVVLSTGQDPVATTPCASVGGAAQVDGDGVVGRGNAAVQDDEAARGDAP